jgi:hypothetical protein
MGQVGVLFNDASILRLYLDTTVKLEAGLNQIGEPVAQVILNDGTLW